MDFNSFIQRIKSVEKAPQKFFIVDPDLPLSVFFGLDRLNRPTLLIEDIGKVFSSAEIPSTAQILVISFCQKGKACLSFSLLSPEHRDVFNTLCYDLFESTRKESKEKSLLSLLDRFYAWRRLLKGTRPGVMSVREQQGLASELKALLHFSESMGFETALDAWVGPFMMDKDFEFHDTWAEIKSCKVSATVITISSIEQLDSEMPGKLLVYHLDCIPENKDDAFSLADVVREVRSSATSVASRTLLDNKLFLAHYMDNEPEYEKKQFKLYCYDSYRVTESFPCLRRKSLSASITACNYSVSLPAIEEFKEVGE
jgi:hypothetical protein